MYQKQVNLLVNFLMVVDALAIILGGYLGAYFSLGTGSDQWKMGDYHLLVIILFLMFVGNFLLDRLGLYSARRAPSLFWTIRRATIGVAMLFGGLTVIMFYTGKGAFPQEFILTYAGIVLGCILLSRVIFEAYAESRAQMAFNTRQILIVGSSDRAELVRKALQEQKSWGHFVIGFVRDFDGAPVSIKDLPELGTIKDMKRILVDGNVDEVVFALSAECERGGLKEHVTICEEIGISHRILPSMYDPADQRTIRVETIQGVPTLTKDSVAIDPSGLVYKKILDLTLGLVGVVFLALMYPIVALAIKLDSKGPVFFKQLRVGQHGRLFHVYKFRTMVQDADKLKDKLMEHNEMNGQMFKLKDDPRVTKVGRFLRKTSLDEFPQFLNVIRGEMSLVGTRPPTPDEVKNYEIHHRRRISMRPGITGLWQVSGRNKINDFEEVVRLDLQYIDNWRFWKDIRIIFKTVQVVLARKGAC